MRTKITDTVEQMIQYKKDGLTNVQIAAKFNCSKTAVNNYYSKIGYDYQKQTALINTQQELESQISRKKTGSKTKNIDVQQVIDLHNQGWKDYEIAEKFGCTRSNITYHLNKHGITNRKSKIDNLSCSEI